MVNMFKYFRVLLILITDNARRKKKTKTHPNAHENEVVCVYSQSVSAFGSKVLPVIANRQEINASMQSKTDQTDNQQNR